MIDDFIKGNKIFVEEDFKKNKGHYSALSKGQSPKALWIACSDSRVDPERITSARMGEIFVHRNIGNLVPKDDLNIATVLEYAVNHLKVKDIVVCGHSNCGAIKALVSGCSPEDCYIPKWLENAPSLNRGLDSRNIPAEDLRDAEIQNIEDQVENLKSYSIVREALDSGSLAVHGLYYNLETGFIEKVT